MDKFHEQYKVKTLNFLYSLKSKYGIEYKKRINQSGGKLHFKTYRYMDNKFNVKIDDDDKNDIVISVVGKDNTDCVTVFVCKEENIAVLHNMSYYPDCAVDGLKNPGGGDMLLRFILTFLINNKIKYEIKRIVLEDRSFLLCGKNNDSKIRLAQLRIVTHGKHWYMKYGFNPYDPLKRIPDEKSLLLLDYNIKMLEKLETKHINIWKIVDRFKNINKSKIKKIIESNILYKDFIKELSKNFDEFCPLIGMLIDKIYSPLVDGSTLLHDFYGKHYYVDI